MALWAALYTLFWIFTFDYAIHLRLKSVRINRLNKESFMSDEITLSEANFDNEVLQVNSARAC